MAGLPPKDPAVFILVHPVVCVLTLMFMFWHLWDQGRLRENKAGISAEDEMAGWHHRLDGREFE